MPQRPLPPITPANPATPLRPPVTPPPQNGPQKKQTRCPIGCHVGHDTAPPRPMSVLKERALALLFAAGGVGIFLRALGLGMGTLAEPGPGLWPAVVGVGLMICGALQVFGPASPLLEKRRSSNTDTRPVISLMLACGLWLALLTPLGWIPATLAAGVVACRGAGDSLSETLWLMVLLVAGLYFGVEKLLGWPLPGGAFTWPAAWPLPWLGWMTGEAT